MNYFYRLSKNTSPLNMALIETPTNNAPSRTIMELEYFFLMILGLILGYAAKMAVDSTTVWMATISIDEITSDDILDLSWWIMCHIPSFLWYAVEILDLYWWILCNILSFIWYAVEAYVNLLLTLAIPETGPASGLMIVICVLAFIGTIGRFVVWIFEMVFTLINWIHKHV